jgi:hypothetical protein
VTVVLRHNEQLELNLAEYRGSVTLAELKGVAVFAANNLDHLRRDSLNVVLPGADFQSVDLATLDALFSRYRAMFAPLDFQIFRRSAWVIQSPQARAHVHYWVNGRDTREAMSSAVREFETFAEAGDWLLLSDAELALVQRGEGFNEIARFEDAAPLPRAAAG